MSYLATPLISCITPTGDRPEAFALCRHYMERQTFKNFEWIVIDDGVKPMNSSNIPALIIRAEPKPEERTLSRNLLLGLDAVNGEYIAFIEDDDWYSPEWLETAIKQLVRDEGFAYGERLAKYYNVNKRCCRLMGNRRHASLCQTVIHVRAVEALRSIIAKEAQSPFIDIPLWAHLQEKGRCCLVERSTKVIGIKGMPGRKGIGTGHRVDGDWDQDADLSRLKEWIGEEDAILYQSYRNNANAS